MKYLLTNKIFFVFFVLILFLSRCDQFLIAQTSGTVFPNYSPSTSTPATSPALSSPSPTLPNPNPNPNHPPTSILQQPHNNNPAPETNPNSAKEPIKRIATEREKHDAIVLFNPNSGHFVVLPGGWSVDVLEDFAKFLMRGANVTTPNFTINTILAKGKLVDSRIETTIQFNISTNNDKTIKIPLGLKEGIIPVSINNNQQKPELSYSYSSKSNITITVDPLDGQYIAIISPPTTLTPKQNITENKQKETIDNYPNISAKIITEAITNPTPDTTPITATVQNYAATSSVNVTDEHHEISLTLWFPVNKLADGSHKLAISFTHAVSSQFILTIPSPNITAVAQATLINPSQVDNGKSTQFTILGLKPNFDITWRKKNTESIEPRPILEIKDANILVQIDPRFIAYDATLPVRSLQNTFDKFMIRLPKDAVLDIENSEKFATGGGYSIRLLSAEERNTINRPKNKSNNDNNDQTKTDQTSIIEIQTKQKTLGPLNVRLVATRRLQAATSSAVTSDWNEIEGFDVLGAQRQYGVLSITIPDGMRPNWRSIRGINRIDITPAAGIAAQFRFSLQPFLLRGQIITPQVRTNIKPEYQVRIEKGMLSMTMRLACTVPWSQIHSLSVQLFDWQWSGEITPTNIINVGGVEQTTDGILNIPLSNVIEEDFEIDLKLHRKFDPATLPPVNNLQPDRKLLTLRFPQPQANWVEPSIVVIVPGDNIDLTPVIDVAESNMPHTAGLTRVNRRTSRINIELPQRQREPLIYQSDLPNPIFVTETEFHKQKIETNIKTDIKLLDQKEQIQEIISYDVAYEPVDRITLAIPRILDTYGTGEYGGIQAFIGNTFLRLRDAVITENNNEKNKSDYVKKFIMLPEAMIGKFEIGIKYSIQPINVSEDLSESVLIPFVKPLNVTINSHKVNLIAPAGINAELREESKSQWKNIGTISPIIVTKNNDLQNKPADNSIGNKSDTKSPVTAESQIQSAKISTRLQKTMVFESTFRISDSLNSDETTSSNIDPDCLQLLISSRDRDIFGTTIVERAWIQTWLSDSLRVDRAVYVVSSSRDSLTIRVPDRVTPTKITVKKNGVTIPVELTNGLQITIPLHESENGQANTIELWYQIPGIFRNKIQRVQFSLPQFNDDVLVRRSYWQLILPPNRFIPFIPTGWTPEYRYTYNGLLTGQKTAFTMSDVGISQKSVDEVLISDNASQFLFSSLSSSELVPFILVDRSVIVLISSSIALLAGLILVYFPKTRYVGLVAGLVVVLPAILFWQSVSGLLFLQAASIGIVLAIAAGYVYKLCYSEKQWILPTEKIKETDVYSVIIDESTNRTHGQNNSKSATIGR
ncbi:MAG: hypothetical protein LBC74_12820 [Planctomycetaceae bacterium]|jgi:hypothetical protein|nr:hypothetical protein [Planctomycetaceae bacterium]